MKTLLILLFISGLFGSISYADTIDMEAIAIIESSGGKYLYGKFGEIGKWQISQITIDDYNQYHKEKFLLNDMLSTDKCKIVADWYISKRIPQMLRHFGHEVSIKNILWAYNQGIKHVGKDMSEITHSYLIKYNKLTTVK